MGADERMFAKLRPLLPELIVPEWLPPLRRESLRSYARRMAGQINPELPCFVGGASFGGFLALEMLPHLNAKGCFLIGAVRSPSEFPLWIRLARPAHALTRIVPVSLFLWLSAFLGGTLGFLLPRRTREFLQLGGTLDPAFFKWAAEAVLTWGDFGLPPNPACPVYHVQGELDRILPPRLTQPDELIAGGGHVIALSHPAEVARFIRLRLVE